MDLNKIIESKLEEIRENTVISVTSTAAYLKEEDYLWMYSTIQNLAGIVREQGNLIKNMETTPKNVQELKHKRDTPTIISYKGKRYVYDPNY